jgi:DHA1 family bicyclomycin/chloramphenicol resistance-like MFS transporter
MLRSEIYKSYSKTTRIGIVLTCALIAALTPFTDTIYLPALKSISIDLDASDSTVSLSISIYLACVAIGQFFWSPFSDKYGRLPVLACCLIVYEVFTIACIFANTINVLIAERAVQGFIIASTLIISQNIITDVFHPNERGTAMGNVIGPMLLGPVIAPLIGGILCQEFTWR